MTHACPGGCGTEVPEGQKCVACATAAVVMWKAAKRAAELVPKQYALPKERKSRRKK